MNNTSLGVEDEFNWKSNSQGLEPLNASVITCVPDSVEKDEEIITCDKEDAGASSDDMSKHDNINQEKELELGNEDDCSLTGGNLDRVSVTKKDYSGKKHKATSYIDTEDICYPSVEVKAGKVGFKRKTFLLDTSPVSKDGFRGLVTESIDVESVIGEAVQGILDQERKETLGEDDLSTQEVEKLEMILSMGDEDKNLKHDEEEEVIVGEENAVNRLSKSRGWKVHDEFGSSLAEKEKPGRRLVRNTPGKVEADECQPSYRCTASSKPRDKQHSIIQTENSESRHSQGVIDLEKQDGVNSSDNLSTDNNSISLLQPPVVSAVAIDKVCAILASNKRPSVIDDTACNVPIIYSGSCEVVESCQTLERDVGFKIVTELTKVGAACQEASSDNSTESLNATADSDRTNSNLRVVEGNLDSCGSDFEPGVSGKLKNAMEKHNSLSSDLSRSAKEIPFDHDLLNSQSKEATETIAINKTRESVKGKILTCIFCLFTIL